MAQCVGVKKSGVRCTVMVFGEVQYCRCAIHMKTLNKVGPNNVRREELKYIHKHHESDIYDRFHQILRTIDGADYIRQIRVRDTEIREEELRHRMEINMLEATIDRETDANGGIDADQPFLEHAREVANQRRAAAQELWEHRQNERRVALNAHNVPAQVIINNAHVAGGGELANLANDRQNVHTAVVVQKVKESIQKILQVPVPPEYQVDTLKTTGEIILECGLTRASAWQMMAKYCSDDDIYDMGNGIYGRVLNSVWQYIKASPDAADLKKILASEMRDNIGMCAQGNLSRLCNILSGYMEGLNVDVKSKNEILGERLATLMDVDDAAERQDAGVAILLELKVPIEEWENWLAPLRDI